MTLPLLIAIYITLAGGLVYLSDKLGGYIDLLDRKTKISGAFLGGVLLAAVTSLPELFTSISATLIIREKELVVGNVLGSNLFNLLVLGFCFMFFHRIFRKSNVDYKSHFFTILGVGIIYVLLCYGLFVPSQYQPLFGPINLICPLALMVYGIIIFLQPKSDEIDDEDEKVDNSSLSIKQIVFRFIICAIILVFVSIQITYVTDALGEELNIGATVAGALFLAIATSLPELVSCIALCRRGNFNAALGDICGSCFFNFCIIGISEFLSYDGTLLTQGDKEAIPMVILAMFIILIISILLFIKKAIIDKKNQEQKVTWFSVLTIFIGALSFSGYIVYLLF